MTDFEIAFMLLGAFTVLSVSMWAKYNGAYHQLNDIWTRESRIKDEHIETLKREIAFWRAHFDKDATDHANDNA